MSRAKLPRKSTHIDMTAMCDVAFLLLSFFILTTKTKPPEAVAVMTPSSVSTKVASDEAILVTLTKEGKVFLLIGDKSHKNAIIDNVNTAKSLGLNATEITKLRKLDFIGVPFSQLKSYLDLATPPSAASLPGIPIDSTNNELTVWIRGVRDSYKGENMDKLNLLVKGDNQAKYPNFKDIKESFKKNDIFKFKVVTNSEAPPAGSELANAAAAANKK